MFNTEPVGRMGFSRNFSNDGCCLHVALEQYIVGDPMVRIFGESKDTFAAVAHVNWTSKGSNEAHVLPAKSRLAP